jgi:hypothetical protein
MPSVLSAGTVARAITSVSAVKGAVVSVCISLHTCCVSIMV